MCLCFIFLSTYLRRPFSNEVPFHYLLSDLIISWSPNNVQRVWFKLTAKISWLVDVSLVVFVWICFLYVFLKLNYVFIILLILFLFGYCFFLNHESRSHPSKQCPTSFKGEHKEKYKTCKFQRDGPFISLFCSIQMEYPRIVLRVLKRNKNAFRYFIKPKTLGLFLYFHFSNKICRVSRLWELNPSFEIKCSYLLNEKAI